MNTTEYLHCDNCSHEIEIDWDNDVPVYADGMAPSIEGNVYTFDVVHTDSTGEDCETTKLLIFIMTDGEGNGYLLR